MATREPTVRYAAPIQEITSRLRRPGWPVIAVPLLAFAVAFALDVATDRRFSQVWGSLALVASAGGVPAVRRSAVPVMAYVGVWVGFNALRAAVDGAGLGLVPRQAVSGLESMLSGGELPSAIVQRTVLDPSRLGVAQFTMTAVYLSFFVVPHVVASVLLVRNRDLFWRAVVASALLFGAGVVAFAVAPIEPPWMAASADPSLGDVDRLPRLVLGELGVRFGEGAEMDQGYEFEPNPLASMPSIHLGVTVLIAAAAWHGQRFRRWLATTYATAMGIALVACGEHYVLDVIAGALLAVAAWVIAIACRILAGRLSALVRGARGRPGQRSVSEARLVSVRAFGREDERRSAHHIRRRSSAERGVASE